MIEMEQELKAMLAERAGDVRARRPVEPALQRARRRRVATAGAAAVLSLALVTGAVATVGELGRDPAVRPASPEDASRYSFASTPGDYPYVAIGRFRDVEWELRAAAVTLRPSGGIRVSVTMESGRHRAEGSFQLPSPHDTLVPGTIADAHVLGERVQVVFGAVTPDVVGVDVEIRDGGGMTIPAHLFNEYEGAAGYFAAGYYVAFVPRGADADVVAKDAYGKILDREPLPSGERSIGSSPEQ